MTNDQQFIDDIVRGVLDQLQQGEQSSRAPRASGGRQPPDPSHNPNPSSHSASSAMSVSIDAQVITGELLESRVNGATTIVINPTAILTPSGRDVVRSRRLRLTRQVPSPSSTGVRWRAIVGSSTSALARALDDARADSPVVGSDLAGTDGEAARSAVGQICRGDCDGVVVFSAQPQLVACLANRHRRVRAASAGDAGTLKRVVASMGANVLCLDPADRSYFELTNILRQLPADRPPAAPDDWPE